MCLSAMLVWQVAGSLLLDLNIETRIDLIDTEDRRFVFNVSQPSTKKYEIFFTYVIIIMIRVIMMMMVIKMITFDIHISNIFDILSTWESLAENIPKWQQLCHQQTALFNENRHKGLKHHRQQWKDSGCDTSRSDNAGCICGHNYRSCIELFFHKSKCHQ